jgi:DUF4097 and DUF4098 domain-containing protein YvlB
MTPMDRTRWIRLTTAIVTAAALAGAATAAAAQDRNYPALRTDRQTRTLTLGSAGSLDLSNVSGDITVTAGPGTSVVVDVTRESHGRTEADAAQGLQDVQVAIETQGDRATVATQYPKTQHGQSPYRVSTIYHVTAPAGTHVKATSVSGNVSVSHIKGDLEVQVVSGNVTVSDAARVTNARTISGTVRLSDVASDAALSVSAVSGDVTLERVKAARVSADVVSGNVRATDVTCGGATLKSLSGTVDYTGPLTRGGRYELTSHSGTVTFTAVGPVGFALDASTFSGSIQPVGSLTLTSQIAHRGSLTGTVGDGGATVAVRTFSGNVRIARR